MNFTANAPPGAPTAILQTSTVLQRAVPIQGKSQVMATWVDRNGKSTGDAAWLSSPYGWWMTHVLLADGDENLKARLCASFVGSVDSSQWSPARAAAKADAEFKSLRAYAAKQKPSCGEIHAVWDHSGCGLYPGNWPKTMKLLRLAALEDISRRRRPARGVSRRRARGGHKGPCVDSMLHGNTCVARDDGGVRPQRLAAKGGERKDD